MQMPTNLSEMLKLYVHDQQPFGPSDASCIEEPQCAAELFDWYNLAFAELLKGSHVIIGRRGSGKTTLLRILSGKQFLNSELLSSKGIEFRDRYRLSSRTLTAIPDVVVDADTPTLVRDLADVCGDDIPVVEILARKWKCRIWLLIGEAIQRSHPDIWDTASPGVRAYIEHTDLYDKLDKDSSKPILSPDEFIKEMENLLRKLQKRCVVTFDNMESYRLDDNQNSVLAALCAATGQFINRRISTLDVKLCLPSELFGELKNFLFQPDKSLHKKQFLHWNAAELMHLAAHRLRLFLELNQPDAHARVKDWQISDRHILKKFWLQYLPEKIENSIGITEETFTYILRHTQLLPRQLLSILNNIAIRFMQRRPNAVLFEEPFIKSDIILGIQDSEQVNKDSILFMYQVLYPNIQELFSLVFPRLKRTISYGELQSIWQSSAKALMDGMGKPEFIQFWRLMLSTGAIGVLQSEFTSNIYEQARFEFNTRHLLQISDKDKLCVHPMFSRLYNMEQEENAKVILPRGSDFRIDEHEQDR